MLSFPRLALAVVLAGASLAARAQPAVLPPAEDFFGFAPIRQPLLSPNGKQLAVVVGGAGRRDELVVIDLATDQVHRSAIIAGLDVGRVRWVNNERLMFTAADKLVGQSERTIAPGLYAVNVDGTERKQLALHRGARAYTGPLLPSTTLMMQQYGAQDSDEVYVETAQFGADNEYHGKNLIRLNTVTGASLWVPSPGLMLSFLLDNKGEPRLATRFEGTKLLYHYRDEQTQAWRKLVVRRSAGTENHSMTPVGFGAPGILYVASTEGHDVTRLYAFDIASGKLDDKALISAQDYDFEGGLTYSNGKLVGFTLTTDAVASMWFDPAWKAVQDEVDRQLPGTANIMSVPARPQSPWVLVQSYSDVQPEIIYVFNTATKALKKIGDTHPKIVASQMGNQEVLRYKARDGLSIPAMLTLPAGAERKNLPLVVLVHGGPWRRGGTWEWNPQVQFLASRGYAVLQPEFRGSTGFGTRHAEAGWKQWGLAMQNDIADGAKWAIAQGIVDPKRICIAGGDFGGYAALMGLVNDPDVFKCAINWAGVTDIELLYKGSWGTVSTMSSGYGAHRLPEWVGDLVKDAAQFKATSPLQQAARIKQPVLLAYGGVDARVPLHHGEKFYKAVKAGNPNVELTVYPNEGHDWSLPETRIDFWTRVEKFLDRHIGKR